MRSAAVADDLDRALDAVRVEPLQERVVETIRRPDARARSVRSRGGRPRGGSRRPGCGSMVRKVSALPARPCRQRTRRGPRPCWTRFSPPRTCPRARPRSAGSARRTAAGRRWTCCISAPRGRRHRRRVERRAARERDRSRPAGPLLGVQPGAVGSRATQRRRVPWADRGASTAPFASATRRRGPGRGRTLRPNPEADGAVHAAGDEDREARAPGM